LPLLRRTSFDYAASRTRCASALPDADTLPRYFVPLMLLIFFITPR